MQLKSRSAKWDNLKFVLIFLVVLGHLLYPFREESELVKGIYLFIYLFHMPLFIFVSGLFSKTIIKKKQWDRAWAYLVLYLFIRLLDTIGTLVHVDKLKLNFLQTNGPDWYALSVFLFLIITIGLQKVKPWKLLLAAFAVGLVVGFVNLPGNLLSFMRTCVFYPFFLMGYYADRKQLEELSRPSVYFISTIVVLLVVAAFLIRGDEIYPFIHVLKAKRTFDEMNFDGIEGVIRRGIQYGGAFMVGSLVLMAVPEQESVFTEIGKHTLPVFVWHYLFLKIFWGLSGKELMMTLFPDFYFVVLLCLCFGIILLFSSGFFAGTEKIMGVFVRQNE